MIQQNDASELLEVFDARGQPTGVAKARAAIHLDGDWHVAFHCWILRKHATEVVLQRRSLAKDTYAGHWDAAAAGHWRFGETPPEAAREIAEELGIVVDFSDLLYRGRERTTRHFVNGLIDRELHEVYVLESDAPLTTYRPDPAEVNALAMQNTVSNSVVFVKQEGDDRSQLVELDWLLEITGKAESHVYVRRETMVKCRLERQKNRWRIVAFDPQDFFTPPNSDAR